MSMLGKWAPWYQRDTALGTNYGPVETYFLAEQFLTGLDVEDWGCGYGYFRTIHNGGYIGIDGTVGYCDIVADLTEYTSNTEAILCRGVLDHNSEWRKILDNLLVSFTKRAVVLLFTPPGNDDILDHVQVLDVYDYALPHDEISATIRSAGCTFEKTVIPSEAGYHFETMWTVTR